MKKRLNLLPCIIFLLIFIILGGCAAKVKMIPPPSQASTLRYVISEGQPLTYSFDNGFEQSISVMGVPIKTTILKDMVVTFYQLAYAQETYQLQGIINDISMKVDAPGTNLTPNLSHIPGKSFEITVTNTGEEIGVIGADELTYTFGNEGEQTLEQEFGKFFPDLPENPVNPGDTWTTTDTVSYNVDGMETTVVTVSDQTLEGYELVNGHECAKINGIYNSTITASGVNNGANMETFVEIKGKETLYFDGSFSE